MMYAPPSKLPWPPMLYLAAIATSVVLNTVLPLPWIGSPMADILFASGILCVIGMVAIYFSALRELKRANTTVRPNKVADHLVTKGAFSFSRNPIYLANTLLLIGIALVTGIAWFIPMAVIAAFATQKLAIKPEEKHLAQRFGKRFHDYAKRVRRWI